MNSIEAATYLVTDDGKRILKRINDCYRDKNDILKIKEKFDMPTELFQSALSIVEIRRKAIKKFENGGQMYFTRDGYEMATSEEIAKYRALRFNDNDIVYDLCCGIGGDLLALANHVKKVIAVDKDDINIIYAKENAKIAGLYKKIEFISGDVNDIIIPDSSCIFIDPSRRSEKNAGRNPDKYSPPLSWVFELAKRCRKSGVKVSPAIDFSSFTDFEIELISYHGECKEAILWCGELKKYERVATVLPFKDSISSFQLEDNSISEIKKFIYEPDPAIIRAGLVTNLAGKYYLSRIDDEIAYLTGDFMINSPVLKSYSVNEVLPWSLKHLNSFLRDNEIGKVIIKKRGFPMLPDQVEKKLKLKGNKNATIILTRIKNKHFSIICDIK
jgi:SAM-dependent methyltransferase